MKRKITIIPFLSLLVLALLVMGVSSCGSKNQGGKVSGGEDQPLSPVEGRRGSESIIFSRNDNPAIDTSETEHFFIIDNQPGDSPTRIDKERMLFTVKTPDGNSLAYLSPFAVNRAITLYDIDTGSERVFQVGHY